MPRKKKVEVPQVEEPVSEPEPTEEPQEVPKPEVSSELELTLENKLLEIYNREASGNVFAVQRLADETGATVTAVHLAWVRLFEAGKVPSVEMRKP